MLWEISSLKPTPTLCPVILAGGEGSRLWPLSRRNYPKPFVRLFGDRSLLQQTLLRCAGMAFDGVEVLPALVICNEACRFLAAEQVAATNHPAQAIMLEPVARNTAPALTAAALTRPADTHDPILLMLPSDHLIGNASAMQQALAAGIDLARDEAIVTFGIDPSHAASGYGYIRRGDEISISTPARAFHLTGFMEKPDEAQAAKYIASGQYHWNSGIFMVRASVWLAALERLQPDMYRACVAACRNGEQDGSFFRLANAAFVGCPSASVDVAVMEKLDETGSPKAAVIPLDCAWSDVGAWNDVWEQGVKDENGNVAGGDALSVGTSNSLIHSDKRLVTALGCEDLVIVETADAVLVADKRQSQDVRQLVEALTARQRQELEQRLLVQRPWGAYEVIEAGQTHQVKRLTISPGRKISLQLHRRRSEHWIVVKGTATVTRGKEVFDLAINESTFIPVGVKHRLENRTASELEIIEVQVGDYLGEDDIVRFDDEVR